MTDQPQAKKTPFSAKKFLIESFPISWTWWAKPLNLMIRFAWIGVVAFLLFFLAASVRNFFFPVKKPKTIANPITLAEGASVGTLDARTTIYEQAPLKQGLYISGAVDSLTGDVSGRASVGAFKEIARNFDISAGVGVSNATEESDIFVESELRFKF